MILWLVSCTTTQINKPAPKVTPPDPIGEDGRTVWDYVAEGEEYTASEDGVFLPFWYFEKIFDYIVDTQAAQKITK